MCYAGDALLLLLRERVCVPAFVYVLNEVQEEVFRCKVLYPLL